MEVTSKPDPMEVTFSSTHLFIAVDSEHTICTGKMLDGASKGFESCRVILSACAYRRVQRLMESSRGLDGFNVIWLA